MALKVNGAAVKALRERSGFNQGQFSRMIGVDQSTMTKIEAGTRNPSPALAKKIAAGLKVDMVAILAEVGQ